MIKADGNLLQTITRSNSSTSRTERITWEKRSNYTHSKADRALIQSDICYKNPKDDPEGTCKYNDDQGWKKFADLIIEIDGGSMTDTGDSFNCHGCRSTIIQVLRQSKDDPDFQVIRSYCTSSEIVGPQI